MQRICLSFGIIYSSIINWGAEVNLFRLPNFVSMKSSFTYRQGTIEDVNQLKELGIVSYTEFGNALTDENWATLNNFLNRPDTWTQLVSNARCFICEENNRMIGMAFLMPSGNPTKIYQADW